MRRFVVAVVETASLVAIAPGAVRGADWQSGPSFSGAVTIEFNSLGPSTRIAGASGVWVRHAPTLSVDCSPPRGCYATTQRIYYSFVCNPRYAMMMERLSMDLNGAIIKHEVFDGPALAYDEGANLVLNTFCQFSELYPLVPR